MMEVIAPLPAASQLLPAPSLPAPCSAWVFQGRSRLR